MAENGVGGMLLTADVVVVGQRRVLLVVVMRRRDRRSGLDIARLKRPGSSLSGRRHIRIGDKLVAWMDCVRILGRRLEGLQIGSFRLRPLFRAEDLRVLVARCLRWRCRLRLRARLPEDLGLLAPDLVFGGAVGALQLEVLAYRVVENPHAGRDQRAAAWASARSTRLRPPRLAR